MLIIHRTIAFRMYKCCLYLSTEFMYITCLNTCFYSAFWCHNLTNFLVKSEQLKILYYLTYNYTWKCYSFIPFTSFTLFLFSSTSLGFVFKGTNWFGSSILIGVPPLVFEDSSAFIHLKEKKYAKNQHDGEGQLSALTYG